MKLSQRTILITGGTSGIGLELARQLIARDNVVIVTGRSADRIAQAKRSLPQLHAVQSDVTDPSSIRQLYETLAGRFPTLDSLINNAGIMRSLRLAQHRALEDVTSEIDIDLTGPMRMVQQFMPHLLLQPNALIVNVSSGLAFVPFAAAPIYSAAKAGLHAYTRCLRAQLHDTRINVVELAPPLTETPLYSAEYKQQMNGQKAMAADTLVRAAIRGIEAGKSEIRPGLANVLKIASRVAPGTIFRQLAKVGRD